MIGLIALGNWQLRRLDWKLDLIERVEQRAYGNPVNAPTDLSDSNLTAAEHEYLRVSVRGQFDHRKETLVWAATDFGNGYWVITPLQTENLEIILINRGFVPLDKAEQSTRTSGLVDNHVEITGLLRLSEPEGVLLRKNDPGNERWYSRDVDEIARARGLTHVAPYFIDADAMDDPTQLPMGGLTQLKFRNPHLVYAMTWYGLSLLLFVLTVNAIRISRKD